MYSDNDLLSFYDGIQEYVDGIDGMMLGGNNKIFTNDYRKERFIDFEIITSELPVEIVATIEQYRTDNTFRVEVVVGNKEIDTTFAQGGTMGPLDHTIGVINSCCDC